MRKFWSHLAVQLGKRAGLVSIIGLAITLLLGLGIPKLEFATGQDSYLNKDDQVAKDNVAYQKLFGGQIMLVLFTMDEGHSVAELAEPENAEAIEAAKAEILKSPAVEAVVSPLDTLAFSENTLSRTPDDPTNEDAWDPLASIAAAATNEALAAEKPGSPAAKAREADFAETAERLGPFLASTPEQRTLSNPEWVDVLLHDNQGKIRKPLLSSFFDEPTRR